MNKTILEEVAEMSARLVGDPAIKKGIYEHAEKTRFIFMLETMRMNQGLSQRELARKMGYRGLF